MVAQTVLCSLHTFSNDLANVIKIDFIFFFLNEVVGGFAVSICQLPSVSPQRRSLQWEQCKLPGGFLPAVCTALLIGKPHSLLLHHSYLLLFNFSEVGVFIQAQAE